MFRNSVLRLCKLLGNPGRGRRLMSGCLCGFECFALLLNHSPSLLHGLPGKKQTMAITKGKAVKLRGCDWLRENTQGEQEGGFSPQKQSFLKFFTNFTSISEEIMERERSHFIAMEKLRHKRLKAPMYENVSQRTSQEDTYLL